MNPFPWHAAELFLKVCEAGGITAASRFGVAGLSQPALSARMMALEAHLGRRLFQRKPFELTSEGAAFRAEAMALRERMERLCHAMGEPAGRPLRIAASDVIIRDHLPGLLRRIDPASRVRLILREAASQDLAGLVRDGGADLAIGMLSRHVSTGPRPMVERLAPLPLALLVPPGHEQQVRDWAGLLRLLRGRETPGLVALPQDNLLMRHFRACLLRLGLDWPATVEVCSLSHVPAYVNLDFGFGLTLDAPAVRPPGSVRMIHPPAGKMPPIHLGVWHGDQPDPLALRLLDHIRQHVRHLPTSSAGLTAP